MLVISSKLIDFKTGKVVGVVCINGETSVALTLDKAKELGVDDIDIIEFLDTSSIDVAINPRRKNYCALLSKSVMTLDNYLDTPYEVIGDVTDIFDKKEIIWGRCFNYFDFIELDNDTSIKRALCDFERED